EKFKDNDEMVRNMVKINGKFAEASIRVSSNVNKISVKYAKRMGFTWKHLNKRNNSHMDDGCIGFIHGVEVVVNDVKYLQKFHVMKDLPVDVVLGTPWYKAFKYRCESMKNDDDGGNCLRKMNRIVSVMNKENVNTKESKREYAPDTRIVCDEDPKEQGREFDDVDETVDIDVVNIRCMDFDKSNRVNEMKMEYKPVASNDEILTVKQSESLQ
ncbi:19640_t:CDS:2, partial [Racocetra fulgida]